MMFPKPTKQPKARKRLRCKPRKKDIRLPDERVKYPRGAVVKDPRVLAFVRLRRCAECQDYPTEPHHYVNTAYQRLDLLQNLDAFCHKHHRQIEDGDTALELRHLLAKPVADLSYIFHLAPGAGIWKRITPDTLNIICDCWR